MRRFGMLLAALLCLACGVAWADDFSLPGLEADSGAYARTLTSRFPAGGTPQARKAAEQAAAAAIRKQDWAAAAAAWETRIAQGDAAPAQWLSLAEAQMRRTPPDATRALQAAWQNFSSATAGAAEVPPLLLMAEALKVLDRPAQAIQALEAAAERAPDDKTIVRQTGRGPSRHRHPGAPRRHRTGNRAAACLRRLHRRAGPPRRFPCRGLGAARPAGAGRGGHPRGRQDLRLRPALGRHHADHVARRHAGRVRPQPGQGHQPRDRHGQPPPAHRLRHADVPAAARPGAGDRPEHGQSLHRQADARAPHRAQRRRLRAQREAGPAGRFLGRRQDRRAERTHRLAGQRRHPEMAAQPQRPHGAADARRAGRIRPRPLRADRPRRRRHAECADRRADDPAHRLRAHHLARHRRVDRAGARLFRRAAARRRHAAPARREQRDPRRDHHRRRRRRPVRRTADARRRTRWRRARSRCWAARTTRCSI